jgi:hypothetical protein
MPPGRWALDHSTLRRATNVPIDLEPCIIEVRVEPGEYLGPRVVDAIPAGDRVMVRREDESLLWLDLRDGSQGGFGAGVPESWWPEFVTGDGALGGYCSETGEITVVPLRDASSPIVTFRLPACLLDREGLVRAYLPGSGLTAGRFS